jgi:hypothetical protein
MAGSLRDGFETDLLELIFNNTDITGIGDGTGLQGSPSAGNFYIALYTVAPTDSTAGTECSYTGYERVAVARTSGGFTIAGNNVSNTAAITFGECTAGPETAVAFAICKADVEDVDDQIIWGDIDSPGGGLSIVVSGIPEFQAGELDVNVD